MSKSMTFSLLLALLLVYNPNFVKENKIRTSAGEYLKQPAFIYQVFRCSPVNYLIKVIHSDLWMPAIIFYVYQTVSG